jgi:uncharacterized protein (DUF362 family)
MAGEKMEKKIGRRTFIRQTATVCALSAVAPQLLLKTRPAMGSAPDNKVNSDMVAVTGEDYYQNTIRAVEQLGGIDRIVSRGSVVGLLANSPFKNYGAHVRPDIVLAVINMCYSAGAKEIRVLREEYQGYWNRSTLAPKYHDEIRSLKAGYENMISQNIPGGVSLKKATITRDLLECDVLINASITKDHTGTRFSCMLKNMMGSASSRTNMSFHLPFNNVDKLSQRIADLNLIRKPDLCVADATEFISTKGPWGPGKILKPKTIAAGRDPVAMDAYCCRFLGLEAKEVKMIQFAHQHGIGEFDLGKLKVLELKG